MIRLLSLVELLWLSWDVDSTEQYMRECNPGGRLDTRMLRHFRVDADAKRVRIALLEKQLRPERRVTRSI